MYLWAVTSKGCYHRSFDFARLLYLFGGTWKIISGFLLFWCVPLILILGYLGRDVKEMPHPLCVFIFYVSAYNAWDVPFSIRPYPLYFTSLHIHNLAQKSLHNFVVGLAMCTVGAAVEHL